MNQRRIHQQQDPDNENIENQAESNPEAKFPNNFYV
jgi:hypothetical protein